VGLPDLGITTEPEETGDTYTENACLKASYYAARSGLPTLADDSGLDVDALGGEPGVRSARYGGPGLDDPGRVKLLLHNLRDVPDAGRTARFVCVIAVAGHGIPPQTVRATAEGVIAHQPVGSGGFGYDPVFFVPSLGQTLAQVPAATKHGLSHRGKAARLIRPLLQRLLLTS
ncbi:MAG: non-canonical purine NTP pyrophosphatase, partial [Dehalococcoidia bacterium]|nr:non-canonical purine NTP pyrophosphatase [Dehalococcoidia bacterium]